MFVLTLAFGVSLSLLLRVSTVISTQSQVCSNFDITLPVALYEPNRCDDDCNLLKESGVVVSIPSDHEIYIGNEKIAKTELTNKLISLMNYKCSDRVVYVKVADLVKFHTLASIIDQIRAADVNRIGLVRNRKRINARSIAFLERGNLCPQF